MSLKDLEHWTRERLESEARKRGVRDVELRSPAELVRLILRHDYASVHSLRSARKWVGSLLSSAAAVLQGRLGTVARWQLTSAPPPSAARQAPAVRDSYAGSAQPAPNAAGRAAAAHATPSPTASAGFRAPATPITGSAAADVDRLDYTRQEAGELRLRWQVTERGAARARAVLKNDGELALRMVTLRPDPADIVRSEVTEHGPIERIGEWCAQLASPDAHCVTAVGLRSNGRFVSIVHATSRP